MSAPLVPSPLDYIGRRKFVLYPPVLNAEPNEWVRGRSSWTGTQLVNTETRQQIWVPWQYICGVSDRPGLQLVVELKEELECRDGSVHPRVTRVIPMPRVAENGPKLTRKRKRRGPAPVVGIRIEDEPGIRTHIISKIALGLVAMFFLVMLVLRLITL